MPGFKTIQVKGILVLALYVVDSNAQNLCSWYFFGNVIHCYAISTVAKFYHILGGWFDNSGDDIDFIKSFSVNQN